jgi:cytochrome c1
MARARVLMPGEKPTINRGDIGWTIASIIVLVVLVGLAVWLANRYWLHLF